MSIWIDGYCGFRTLHLKAPWSHAYAAIARDRGVDGLDLPAIHGWSAPPEDDLSFVSEIDGLRFLEVGEDRRESIAGITRCAALEHLSVWIDDLRQGPDFAA